MELTLAGPVVLELNGQKLASAREVRCRCTRESREIRAFGEAEPVAVLQGAPRYRIELTRVFLRGNVLPFSGLSDFRLSVSHGGRRVTYSGCEWREIESGGEAGIPGVLERAVLTAARRTEEESGE